MLHYYYYTTCGVGSGKIKRIQNSGKQTKILKKKSKVRQFNQAIKIYEFSRSVTETILRIQKTQVS